MTRVERSLIWLAAGVGAAAALAWVAYQVQQEGIAPAVLFPLAVGAALGGALAALWCWTRAPRRRTAITVAIAWGLLAVVAQDYIGHSDRLRDYERQAAMQQPLAAAALAHSELRPTFATHLAGKLREQPVWWLVDLAGTAAAAGIVAAWLMPTGANQAGRANASGARPPDGQ